MYVSNGNVNQWMMRVNPNVFIYIVSIVLLIAYCYIIYTTSSMSNFIYNITKLINFKHNKNQASRIPLRWLVFDLSRTLGTFQKYPRTICEMNVFSRSTMRILRGPNATRGIRTILRIPIRVALNHHLASEFQLRKSLPKFCVSKTCSYDAS